MVLFIISFILIFGSSYFLSSILNREKNIIGLIYIYLLAFANIIFTMEFLSLFSAISVSGILILNFIIFTISLFIWNKCNRPMWSIGYKDFTNKVSNAIKLDKSLAVLLIGFSIFVLSAIYLCLLFPVVNPDAAAYHVARCLFWIQNKNLMHFAIADARALHMPINSELIYTWILIFLKRQALLSFPSFFGYVISMISTYKILDFMKYSMREKLWVIFILSSFAFVIVQASATETDIIIAGLVSSSILMFLYGIKEKREIPVVMSALSYAIAIGVKTPSIFTIPIIGIGFCIVTYKYLGKKDFYKPILRYLAYGIGFFIVFSMYNYYLNLTEWGHIAGSSAFLTVHQNNEGLKAIPATFIKHLFLYVDFTGFNIGPNLVNHILGVRDFIINNMLIFNPADGSHSSANPINQSLLEPLMGPGILGFLLLIPCWIISLTKLVYNRDKKSLILGFFGLALFVNIVIMSYAIQFMTFSIRFMMYFTVLSAPILIYSYKKRGIYKFFVVICAMFYLTIISTHLWARNIIKFNKALKSGISISTARKIARCTPFPPDNVTFKKNEYEFLTQIGQCFFEQVFKRKFKSGTKILFFANQSDEILDFKLNQFYGYKVDTNLLESIDKINLDDYDIVITVDDRQYSSVFTKFATNLPLAKEVNCIYLTKVFLTDASKQYPSNSLCEIKQNYFLERGFEAPIKINYSLIPNSSISKSKEKSKGYANVYYRKDKINIKSSGNKYSNQN